KSANRNPRSNWLGETVHLRSDPFKKTLQKIFEFQNQLQINTHRLIFFEYWKDWTAFLSFFPVGILFALRIQKAILHCASTEWNYVALRSANFLAHENGHINPNSPMHRAGPRTLPRNQRYSDRSVRSRVYRPCHGCLVRQTRAAMAGIFRERTSKDTAHDQRITC